MHRLGSPAGDEEVLFTRPGIIIFCISGDNYTHQDLPSKDKMSASSGHLAIMGSRAALLQKSGLIDIFIIVI